MKSVVTRWEPLAMALNSTPSRSMSLGRHHSSMFPTTTRCREETSKWNQVNGQYHRRLMCLWFFFKRILRRQCHTVRLDLSKLIVKLGHSWANKAGREELGERRWLSQANFRSSAMLSLDQSFAWRWGACRGKRVQLGCKLTEQKVLLSNLSIVSDNECLQEVQGESNFVQRYWNRIVWKWLVRLKLWKILLQMNMKDSTSPKL